MAKAILLIIFVNIALNSGASLDKEGQSIAVPVSNDIEKPKETIETVQTEETVVTEEKPHEKRAAQLPPILEQFLPTGFSQDVFQLISHNPGFGSRINNAQNSGYSSFPSIRYPVVPSFAYHVVPPPNGLPVQNPIIEAARYPFFVANYPANLEQPIYGQPQGFAWIQ